MKKIIALVFLLIFSCSYEKSQERQISDREINIDSSIIVQTKNEYTQVRNKFLINEKDIKWRIFENNINDTLRILRNRIFAKYGYKFKSADLQNYFNSKSWYKINPEYDHSFLTKDDSISIQTIIKYENFLSNLSSDSVKILRNIFDFRERVITHGFDSTIIIHKDITGDNRNDQFITKISFENQKLYIENILKDEKQKLWSEKYVVEPCLLYIDNDDKILKNYPKFGYYYILLKNHLSSLVPRVQSMHAYSGGDYVEMSITGNDTTYELSSLLYNCEDKSDWFKEYLYNFKGSEIGFPDGYCLYAPGYGYDIKVWNNPSKKFVRLWSGP